MSQYSETLASMIGVIKGTKPNVSPEMCRAWINQAIRSVMDRRPYWSGLVTRGVLALPDPYIAGTATMTRGSTTVTGNGTAWPLNDWVNTTLTQALQRPGYAVVTPASMVNITSDSVLLIDAGAAEQEIVPVVDIRPTGFIAKFAYNHPQNAPVYASSLSGLQLRLGLFDPTFTVRAVTSATSLVIDMPWSYTDSVGAAYSIRKIYTCLAPDVKELMNVWDPVQPHELELHVPLARLLVEDPQRSQVGPPRALIDLGANENGNMQYEIYPSSYTARQLPYLYFRQWPDLRSPDDRPPHFINPNVWIWGALSKALRTKVNMQDVWYDPKTADYYELMFQQEWQEAAKADDSKLAQAFTYDYGHGRNLGGGPDYHRSHADFDFN